MLPDRSIVWVVAVSMVLVSCTTPMERTATPGVPAVEELLRFERQVGTADGDEWSAVYRAEQSAPDSPAREIRLAMLLGSSGRPLADHRSARERITTLLSDGTVAPGPVADLLAGIRNRVEREDRLRGALVQTRKRIAALEQDLAAQSLAEGKRNDAALDLLRHRLAVTRDMLQALTEIEQDVEGSRPREIP